MSALARFSSLHPWEPVLRVPARRRSRRRLLHAGMAVLAAVVFVGSGLAAATALLGVPEAAARPDAADGASWIEIRRPIPLYHLSGSAFSRLPAAYRARRRDAGETREDLLAFGSPGDGDKPFLQLSLLRAAGPAVGDDQNLADDLARLAGATGLAARRIHPAGAVETRLGSLDTADLDLGDGDDERSCLGFRGDAGAVLRLSGFACGTPARPASRAAVACAIDRLDLVSAGEDAALRAVFVAAERKGGGSCRPGGGESPLAIGRRGGWLDPDGETPPLRGLFDATARQR